MRVKRTSAVIPSGFCVNTTKCVSYLLYTVNTCVTNTKRSRDLGEGIACWSKPSPLAWKSQAVWRHRWRLLSRTTPTLSFLSPPPYSALFRTPRIGKKTDKTPPPVSFSLSNPPIYGNRKSHQVTNGTRCQFFRPVYYNFPITFYCCCWFLLSPPYSWLLFLVVIIVLWLVPSEEILYSTLPEYY